MVRTYIHICIQDTYTQPTILTPCLHSCLCLKPHLVVPPHLISVLPSSVVRPANRRLWGSTQQGDGMHLGVWPSTGHDMHAPQSKYNVRRNVLSSSSYNSDVQYAPPPTHPHIHVHMYDNEHMDKSVVMQIPQQQLLQGQQRYDH